MTRDKRIEVRVNDEELAKLEEKAKTAGLPVSTYLRQAGLNRHIKPPIPEDVRKSISRWSANLNQVARHANATGKVEAELVEALRSEAREVLKTLMLLVRK